MKKVIFLYLAVSLIACIIAISIFTTTKFSIAIEQTFFEFETEQSYTYTETLSEGSMLQYAKESNRFIKLFSDLDVIDPATGGILIFLWIIVVLASAFAFVGAVIDILFAGVCGILAFVCPQKYWQEKHQESVAKQIRFSLLTLGGAFVAGWISVGFLPLATDGDIQTAYTAGTNYIVGAILMLVLLVAVKLIEPRLTK